MLDIADLDADTVAAFLDHLQTDRGNSARTRNARLAAIHSLYRYAALRHPEHAQDIQRVLSIPPKRTDRALVTFLDQQEIDALLAAPDRTTWTGRRDHALLLLAIQTGLRASELTGLNVADVHTRRRRARHMRGQGTQTKDHATHPHDQRGAARLARRARRRSRRPAVPNDPRPTAQPRRRSSGASPCTSRTPPTSSPASSEKNVTLHTLRHTAAMQLLHAGIDTTVIALWLGHERVETTQIYLHADLALKEKALARTKPPDAKPGRYRPPDTLLAFLEAL